MTEFTGERVVPGEVEPDLWNEHVARYHFAARLARGRRVLDLGCGTGYGSAMLSGPAARVTGLDNSPAAIVHARAHYEAPNLEFLQGSCFEVPLADHSFDLITVFELIEHVADWQALIDECHRLLAPAGQVLISTPNKNYYTESRQTAGPNPFHAREFTFTEFRDALRSRFPHVSLFLQNHCPALVFQPVSSSAASEVRLESAAADPETSHFFVAACALAPQTGGPSFLYVPTSANVLREREHHIARLERELAQKDQWLAEAQHAHEKLLALFQEQQKELESRTLWGQNLNSQLEQASRRIVELQDELAAEQAAGRETGAAYEAKVRELESECAERTRWAQETEGRLTKDLENTRQELSRAAGLLEKAERTVEERTLWAQGLDREREALEVKLSGVLASRWYRMGRRMGLGPELDGPANSKR